MSDAHTSAGDRILLPKWLRLTLPEEPTSIQHLAKLCEQAAGPAIGRAKSLATSVDGTAGSLSEGVRVARAAVEIEGWHPGSLPSPSAVSKLPSQAADMDDSSPTVMVDELTVRFARAKFHGLRCDAIAATAQEVVGRLIADDGAWSLALESARDLSVDVRVTAKDARDALVAQSPFIIDGKLSFQPDGGVVADGRVRVAIFPVAARITGKLIVEDGRDLNLTKVAVRVGSQPLPPATVASKLKEINPLFSVTPLRDAGLPIELLPPKVDGDTVRMRGRAER